jgi:hypothetical protein
MSALASFRMLHTKQQLSFLCRVSLQVKRLPKRAVYDKEQVYAILDEAIVCHVGFTVGEQPFVMPTGFGRKGEWLYLHAKVPPTLRFFRTHCRTYNSHAPFRTTSRRAT